MKPTSLPFVRRIKDRYGNVRLYFRRGKSKAVSLPPDPESEAFLRAYAEAKAANARALAPTPAPVNDGLPRTIHQLAHAYFSGAEFKQLAPLTQRAYRSTLRAWIDTYAGAMVADCQRRHVRQWMAEKVDTPSAANNLLKRLRALFDLALELGVIETNPCAGVKPLKTPAGGYPTWSERDVATFEARHPIGSTARLAFALLLYTAQRRSDVIRMGWQHVSEGCIRVVQGKTGAALWIPIHTELAEILRAEPRDRLTFIITEYGRPRTPAGFGNWFRDRCNDAGLHDRAAHGLRKTASRRLAEAGCTTRQIMAITGHESLDEVERYTKGVDQRHLAKAAIHRLEPKK